MHRNSSASPWDLSSEYGQWRDEISRGPRRTLAPRLFMIAIQFGGVACLIAPAIYVLIHATR
jgi:hypothetical protein